MILNSNHEHIESCREEIKKLQAENKKLREDLKAKDKAFRSVNSLLDIGNTGKLVKKLRECVEFGLKLDTETSGKWNCYKSADHYELFCERARTLLKELDKEQEGDKEPTPPILFCSDETLDNIVHGKAPWEPEIREPISGAYRDKGEE